MTQNIVVSTDDNVHGKNCIFVTSPLYAKPRESNAVIGFFGTSVEMVEEKIKNVGA